MPRLHGESMPRVQVPGSGVRENSERIGARSDTEFSRIQLHATGLTVRMRLGQLAGQLIGHGLEGGRAGTFQLREPLMTFQHVLAEFMLFQVRKGKRDPRPGRLGHAFAAMEELVEPRRPEQPPLRHKSQHFGPGSVQTELTELAVFSRFSRPFGRSIHHPQTRSRGRSRQAQLLIPTAGWQCFPVH